MSWTAEDMPSQQGKTWVVTGANSGLGLETVRALAAKGARVLMACRDPGRAAAAAADVKRTTPGAQLELCRLDVSSLSSINAFADERLATTPVLDGLVNNAGVMVVPRALTADGFEQQLGTNHLGPFALTLRLLPALEASPAGRVVAVSSHTHSFFRVNFDDLMGERGYSAWAAYGQSKLANLLFTYELQRRLSAAGKRTIAVAAHPGYAATNLTGASAKSYGTALGAFVMALGNSLLAQSSAMGALPQLYAATATDVEPGGYYGPDGLWNMFGYPVRVDSSRRSKDPEAARRLWEVSEQLTKARWPW